MNATVSKIRESHNQTFVIQGETEHDAPAREALLDRAMGEGRRRKSSEKLRRGRVPSAGLAFAARNEEGTLIGTVRLWDIRAGRNRSGAPVQALLLGPLAVNPSAEGLGIGSALMRHAIAEAARLGHGAILLVGDPEYYARFGFSGEKVASLAMPGPVERRRFLALELKPSHLDGAHGILSPSGRRAASEPQALRLTA
ncbi:acetyltransferase [Paramesorhizobium deserti]|uniref:Acetyltransferase n=1 Tax=Paramesorhizobium deserti TaxID=1494590 RepID=A0A135HSA5_9HYPH|nr:N-acetyltransferase [Paramesorhizobium deserti]KXF76054.1 acetyltransferase [Paramesorhizobium deserti]